jgi:hypothetical protein
MNRSRLHLTTPVVLSIFIMLMNASLVAAVEIQEGVRYQGGTALSSAEYGVGFTIPPGWEGTLPSGSQFFVMGHTGYQAYVFAGADEMTLADAQQTMSQPIDMGDGVVFKPNGKVKVVGSTLTASYTVSGGQQPLVGYVKTHIGKFGRGIAFLAASPINSANDVMNAVNGINASLSFNQPKAAETTKVAAGSAKRQGPWVEFITGRKLSHFFTRSGYTEEDYIWLCSGGKFYHSGKSGGFGGGASGAFESNSGGVWSVSGGMNAGTLQLHYNDGSVGTYEVTREGDSKLFLDGKRYFREYNDC